MVSVPSLAAGDEGLWLAVSCWIKHDMLSFEEAVWQEESLGRPLFFFHYWKSLLAGLWDGSNNGPSGS